MGLRKLRGLVGKYARELLLLISVFSKKKTRPTLIVLPGETQADGAANLRGYLIADELKRRGWNAFICHKNLGLAQRRRAISVLQPDVLLMQMARHPLNRPSLYDTPVVFDIDDADYCDPQRRNDLVDVLRGSAATIAGSRAIAQFCREYCDRVEIVWTGTPVLDRPPKPQEARPPIVAWAALYPSRLLAEAAFLRNALRAALKLNADFKFALYCEDRSAEFRAFSDSFRAMGVQVVTRPLYTDYEDFLQSLEDVAIGLAPLIDVDGFSGGKSFGKVLAYIDRGVPVLTHAVVDHPLFFKSGQNGFMANTAEEWAVIIADLLESAPKRQQIANTARNDLMKQLTTQEAAKRIDAVLRSIIER